jgi:hypothetical protein
MVWLSKVFELSHAGVKWRRAVVFLDVGLVPLIVFWAIGHEEYLLSALFGLLFASLADPGGGFGHRASYNAVFALIGAGITALAFGIGGEAWGWLALAAFAVTLVAGLTLTFGVHGFVSAMLLNVWFIVAVGLAFNLHHAARLTNHTWAQVVARAGAAALWILMTFVEWLIRGRRDLPQPFVEIPGDTSHKKLTPPIVVFVLLRALVIGGTVALAFGMDLQYGYWIPIAAIIAMKPNLERSALVSAQRLSGAFIGAIAAALLLLLPASETGLRSFAMTRGLEVVALVLFVHAVGIRFLDYALYSAAVAAGALVLTDVPQPSHYAAEGYRVLWTVCGAGISLIVMLLAGLLAKGAAERQQRSA